jgi:hypothetical protein
MAQVSNPIEIGPDGWPTDPNHYCYRATVGTVEQLHASYLGALARGWDDGSLSALMNAVKHCRQNNLPLPHWAANDVLRTLANPDRRLAGADRRNRIHYTRWDMVHELRDRRQELAASGYRPTWPEAYENASQALSGTAAAGSPEVIKKSYQKVERSFRVGKGARFHS